MQANGENVGSENTNEKSGWTVINNYLKVIYFTFNKLILIYISYI